MKCIQGDATLNLERATENIFMKYTADFAKPDRQTMMRLQPKDGKGNTKNHAAIIKQATSLISNRDLRTGMRVFMERNNNATRHYDKWRNELKRRAALLAPSNDNGERYKDRRRKIRKRNDPRSRGVKRQEPEAAQIAGKRFQGSGDDYSTFVEFDRHSQMRLDGDNHHNHERYHTLHRGSDSPSMCILGSDVCKERRYMHECKASPKSGRPTKSG